jgi:hypothetical protein
MTMLCLYIGGTLINAGRFGGSNALVMVLVWFGHGHEEHGDQHVLVMDEVR